MCSASGITATEKNLISKLGLADIFLKSVTTVFKPNL